ncbi:MAG: hypothetical protein O6949_06070 [Chloroflexi bacterium]|nr:hypothetical protein [Chloroflexota bacterium]
MKKSRLQIALVCVLLAGAGLLAMDRCAGEASVGQTEFHGNGGSGNPPSGGSGSGDPQGWDSTRAPLSAQEMDSLLRRSSLPDSVRRRVVEGLKREEQDAARPDSARRGSEGPRRTPI